MELKSPNKSSKKSRANSNTLMTNLPDVSHYVQHSTVSVPLTCLTHPITFNTAQCQYHWLAWPILLRSTQHSVSTTDLPDASHYVQRSTVSVPLTCLTHLITFNTAQCQYP